MDVCTGFYGSWAAAMPSVLVSTSCIVLLYGFKVLRPAHAPLNRHVLLGLLCCTILE
jgi:hypothetical protein